MRRVARAVAGVIGALVALAAAALLLADTQLGHRWIADRIATIQTDSGLRFTVGRIDGSVYSAATLTDVRVYDPRGVFVTIPAARLDWRPFRWFRNALDIRSLAIPRLAVLRAPALKPTTTNGPMLPDFDIAIGRLAVDRIELAAPVTGTTRTGRLSGTADIRAGRALVHLDALVAGSDQVHARIDAMPDGDRFDLDASVRGAADGVLAKMTGLRRALALEVAGEGRWRAWRGTARAEAGGLRVLDLALAARSGDYTISGTIAPTTITTGKFHSLSAPRMLVNGDVTLADRRLGGALSLRSPSLALDTRGAIDLGAGAYRALRVQARLLQPAALFPNMTGRDITLRAVLDGPLATARFDYRLDAERFAFDETGFENVHAAGAGRLSPVPVSLPIRLTAARVTGVGDVAGGILRDFAAEGVLRITARQITGDDLRVRSDKLTGRVSLRVDLDDSGFQVAVNGALGRYLIPGLGLVDVTSNLRVIPNANGQGARAIGTGAARMLRLDDAFFLGLAGGLPRLTTGLERAPDGSLKLTGLVLTGPAIRITGNGLRRADGSVAFEGAGTHASYGPFTLKLDGRIEKPVIDLVFQRPNAALGLSAVRLHLDPNLAGFAFRADGGSRLGPFAGEGEIALPAAGQATIQVERLAVAGAVAKGALAIVPGGFDGRLQLAGGGLSGALTLRPVGDVQRVEAHIDAAGARLGETVSLRRARLDASALLDPAGARIEATATGAGLRRGRLTVARFALNARLTGERGEVRAEISGQRGRAFDIQFVAAIAPDRYVVNAQGVLDNRPLRLVTPAVIAPEGDGWRLSPTRLAFAGGEAEVAGRFSAAASALEAGLTRMPLTILDIGYPGLGLGGVASGKLSLSSVGGRPETGGIDVTVRGLTRSGLALTSRPIDVGLAGVLAPDKLGVRAVMASGGKTIGRAQALLTPLGAGDLAARLAAAPLIAQLRYDGPADTLWRLTGVELFDLSGPVTVAADVGGRLADPSIKGVVRANGARIESAATGTVLTNVQASGGFGGSRLVIDRLAADAGKGGRVTGAGSFDFSATRGVGIDLKLQAQNAQLINTDAIGATVSGPLAFRSTGVGGTISGDVTLSRSRYRLGQATAATALPQLRVREINAPEGDDAPDAPAQPWRLDLRARAPGALSVSGLGLTSEWSADLAIAGDPDDPRITGRATLVRGEVDFAGRAFQIARGVIRFTGEAPANPALDIVADANASNLTASIRVSGTAAKPEIAFTSVPALPQDELLSRLLFGTSITNLSAPEALQLASAVAALQGGRGGLDPINAVRRLARLDRLRIVPADTVTGQGTSLAAGKFVTRRLYAEIVTDGRGYSATQVEFQVTRWLALLSSISTLGRTTGNVRISKDY